MDSHMYNMHMWGCRNAWFAVNGVKECGGWEGLGVLILKDSKHRKSELKTEFAPALYGEAGEATSATLTFAVRHLQANICSLHICN